MFLPPLAALRRHSPPCYMSSNTRQRGLDGVVAAQTRLSHVDGQAGELIIGGYQLSELAGRVSFEEAAHLLWRGALPAPDELAALRREIAELRALPEETMHVVRAAAKTPPVERGQAADRAAYRSAPVRELPLHGARQGARSDRGARDRHLLGDGDRSRDERVDVRRASDRQYPLRHRERVDGCDRRIEGAAARRRAGPRARHAQGHQVR